MSSGATATPWGSLERRDRSRSCRGLHDYRISNHLRERHCFIGRFSEGVFRARKAVGAKYILHLRLVTKPVRDSRPHSYDAKLFANLGERHLELLVCTEQPVYAAKPLRQFFSCPCELRGIEDVVHTPVRGDGLCHLSRHFFGGILRYDGEPNSRQARCCFDHARRILRENRRGENHVGHLLALVSELVDEMRQHLSPPGPVVIHVVTPDVESMRNLLLVQDVREIA